MGNIGSSLILLLVALFILWLAVTGKINRIPDAWNLIMSDTGVSGTASGIPLLQPISLPALPVLNPSTITQRTITS